MSGMLWNEITHHYHGFAAVVCVEHRIDPIEHRHGIIWCPERGDFPELVTDRGRPESFPADVVVVVAPVTANVQRLDIDPWGHSREIFFHMAETASVLFER